MINKKRMKAFLLHLLLPGIVGWTMGTIVTNREKALTERVKVLENKINSIISFKQDYDQS